MEFDSRISRELSFVRLQLPTNRVFTVGRREYWFVNRLIAVLSAYVVAHAISSGARAGFSSNAAAMGVSSFFPSGEGLRLRVARI